MKIVALLLITFIVTGPASAETSNDEAGATFDTTLMWAACQTYGGKSDYEALKVVGDDVLPKIFGHFLEEKPAVASGLAQLLPQLKERYAKQLLFLRSLTKENRETICFGLDTVVGKIARQSKK